jgi:hypothetical protein
MLPLYLMLVCVCVCVYEREGNGEDFNTAPSNHWNIGMSQNADLQAELQRHELQEKLACYQCYKIFYANKQTVDGNKQFCSKECVRNYGTSQVAVCRGAECNNRFNKSEPGRLSGYCDSCMAEQKKASDYSEVARVKAQTAAKKQRQRVEHQSLLNNNNNSTAKRTPSKVVPVLPIPAQPFEPEQEVWQPPASARRAPDADTAAPVVEFPDDSD